MVLLYQHSELDNRGSRDANPEKNAFRDPASLEVDFIATELESLNGETRSKALLPWPFTNAPRDSFAPWAYSGTARSPDC